MTTDTRDPTRNTESTNCKSGAAPGAGEKWISTPLRLENASVHQRRPNRRSRPPTHPVALMRPSCYVRRCDRERIFRGAIGLPSRPKVMRTGRSVAGIFSGRHWRMCALCILHFPIQSSAKYSSSIRTFSPAPSFSAACLVFLWGALAHEFLWSSTSYGKVYMQTRLSRAFVRSGAYSKLF